LSETHQNEAYILPTVSSSITRDGKCISNRFPVGAKVSIVAFCLVVFTLAWFTLFAPFGISAGVPTTSFLLSESSNWCSRENFRDTSLKLAYEQTYHALLYDTEGDQRFEASDVVVYNKSIYVVCDNSWAVGKFGMDMHPFGEKNFQIRPSFTPKNESSDWEALIPAGQNGRFYVVREAMSHGQHFHAHIALLAVNETSRTYTEVENCPSSHSFPHGNKGFEGMVGVFSRSGEMFLLGLCEGNFCKGSAEGEIPGNGRIVVMQKAMRNGTCFWDTVNVIKVPSTAMFRDYSALALFGNKIAITSQVNSQLWIGLIEFGDGEFIKPESISIPEGGKVFDFPRGPNCEVQYCNIEGVAFINNSTVVAVSDKMKNHGRQSYNCFAKDQSIHVFVLPEW